MLEKEFKEWLIKVKKIASVGTRISNVKKVDKVYDLDNEYSKDKCKSLLLNLEYNKNLSKSGVVPSCGIYIDGNYYNGLGTLISAVKLYVEFLDVIKSKSAIKVFNSPQQVIYKNNTRFTDEEKEDILRKLYDELSVTIIPYLQRLTFKLKRDVVISLSDRKKTETQYLKLVLKFIKKNIPAFINYKYDILVNAIKETKNIYDNKPHEENIRNLIRELLEIIIGHNYNKNLGIVEETYYYLEVLDENDLIMVLLGEYIDNHKKVKNVQNEYYENNNICPKIVLYLDNIYDSSVENKYIFEHLLFTVLAHEYLHFHHISIIYEANFSRVINKLGSYNPGKIIKESLASYFEYCYANLKGYKMIAINTRNEWHNYDEKFNPYSGAKTIRDENHFSIIFEVSISSLENAMNEKNN